VELDNNLWAFVARKFRHFQGDSNLYQYTVSELGKCPRGQQEILERLKPAILADRLENCLIMRLSGIYQVNVN